jgi:GT2 family glycosyltransferase
VLVPYRDVAGTLAEALESVLDQEGPSFEVLAVDDGSKDESAAIVHEFARCDPRVQTLSTGGVGIVGALEAARARASAPYLARMDGDDVTLPGRFLAQLRALESDPSVAAVGTLVENLADEPVGEGLERYVAWQNAIVTPEDHAREIFVESPLCHPSVMMRADAVHAVGGYREVAWAEDYDLWLRLARAGHRLAKVPEVLVRWRHRRGRLTTSDPRYAPPRFYEAKATYLAPWIEARGRPLTMWGAGPMGRRLARALEAHGVRTARFVDIDPRKIGRAARGAPIVGMDALVPGRETVIASVGSRGARALIRAELVKRGFVEGEDFVCAA